MTCARYVKVRGSNLAISRSFELYAWDLLLAVVSAIPDRGACSAEPDSESVDPFYYLITLRHEHDTTVYHTLV